MDKERKTKGAKDKKADDDANGLHARDDTDRLYVSRKEGGPIRPLENYIKKSK